MTKSLAGRRVLITGASSGIGAATARALAAAGAAVLATGRDEAALGALARHGIKTMAGDLTNPAFPAELVARWGEGDALIANAGRLRHAPFLEGDPEDWRAVFELNVLATLRLAQCAAAGMVARGRGHIVLVSSLLARRVAPNTLVYAASKHAVAAIAAGLRLELGPRGVRVTEIAPGLVETGILRGIDHAGARDIYASLPFPFLKPEDVADAILAALATRPGASADLIELRPEGQP